MGKTEREWVGCRVTVGTSKNVWTVESLWETREGVAMAQLVRDGWKRTSQPLTNLHDA